MCFGGIYAEPRAAGDRRRFGLSGLGKLDAGAGGSLSVKRGNKQLSIPISMCRILYVLSSRYWGGCELKGEMMVQIMCHDGNVS